MKDDRERPTSATSAELDSRGGRRSGRRESRTSVDVLGRRIAEARASADPCMRWLALRLAIASVGSEAESAEVTERLLVVRHEIASADVPATELLEWARLARTYAAAALTREAARRELTDPPASVQDAVVQLEAVDRTIEILTAQADVPMPPGSRPTGWEGSSHVPTEAEAAEARAFLLANPSPAPPTPRAPSRELARRLRIWAYLTALPLAFFGFTAVRAHVVPAVLAFAPVALAIVAAWMVKRLALRARFDERAEIEDFDVILGRRLAAKVTLMRWSKIVRTALATARTRRDALASCLAAMRALETCDVSRLDAFAAAKPALAPAVAALAASRDSLE